MTIELIIDASVAVKWLVDEPGSDAAKDIFNAYPYRMAAPPLIYYEVANTLWKKLKEGELDEAKAWESIDDFADMKQLRIIDDVGLVTVALRLCSVFKHKAIYDLVYVALAEKLEIPFVTADKELQKKLRGSTYESSIMLLNEYVIH